VLATHETYVLLDAIVVDLLCNTMVFSQKNLNQQLYKYIVHFTT